MVGGGSDHATCGGAMDLVVDRRRERDKDWERERGRIRKERGNEGNEDGRDSAGRIADQLKRE